MKKKGYNLDTEKFDYNLRLGVLIIYQKMFYCLNMTRNLRELSFIPGIMK